MSGDARRKRSRSHFDRSANGARRLFGPASSAGATAYVRARDLPRLLALWPKEIEDKSEAGGLRLLAKLRRALRAERRRAVAGHWSYDLNRHLGLLSAYKGELANLRLGRRPLSHIGDGAAEEADERRRGDSDRE